MIRKWFFIELVMLICLAQVSLGNVDPGLVGRLALIGTNDDCEFAEPIGEVTQLPFDTRQATFDGPGHCMTSPNIWYCYTASCTGQATVSLCGSSYDTMLAVYKGCECFPSHKELIGCNDDFCWLQSQITFNVVAGNNYLIEVGGYRNLAGGGGQGEDPVSHWELDEGSGSTAYDSVGDNDGTIYGATWTTGKYGNALDFDGTNDYVDCGNDNSLNITGNITIAAWIKKDTTTAYQRIVYKVSGRDWYQLLIDNSNYLAGGRVWGASDIRRRTTETLSANTWYHVAIVSDSTNVTLYINSVDKTYSVQQTGWGPAGGSTLKIGQRNGDAYFNGTIDEVMIFDQALSEQQIEQLYDQGDIGEGVLTITCEGLAAVEHDLGDAPDSSNNISTAMNAYSIGKYQITANFPTTSLSNSGPKGPIHLQPLAVAHLGKDVTFENEADKGPDQDGFNNIDPPGNAADMDGADDGVVFPVQMPHCGWTTIDYFVNVKSSGTDLWVNIWCDWNRDGDWDDDSSTCPDMNCRGQNVSEWAVQNQYLFGLQQGLNYITTPAFLSWHPQDGPEDIWMRITLSEQPWKSGEYPGRKGNGGSGPAEGYEFGETEDYLFVPDMVYSLCQDFNGDGRVDFNDLNAMILKWMEFCRE
jgi:hypothetical protein